MERLNGYLYNVQAHTGIINTIDTAGSVKNCGPSEILTGGEDGMVKVWDPRCREAVVQIPPNSNVSETFLTAIYSALKLHTDTKLTGN